MLRAWRPGLVALASPLPLPLHPCLAAMSCAVMASTRTQPAKQAGVGCMDITPAFAVMGMILMQ